jgi:hypothetical protein
LCWKAWLNIGNQVEHIFIIVSFWLIQFFSQKQRNF